MLEKNVKMCDLNTKTQTINTNKIEKNTCTRVPKNDKIKECMEKTGLNGVS